MAEPQLTSIIMVTYHTGAVIEQAIASVKALKEDVELVIVNNGNPKKVEAQFFDRFKEDPQVRYITGHGNIGFGRACNLGARMAKGDRILILNPDCVLPTDTLRHLYQQEKGLHEPFVLGARLVDDYGVEHPGGRRALLTPMTAFVEGFRLEGFFPKHRFNYHKDPVPKGRTQVPAISGAFMYMTAKTFHDIHGFDERFFLHVEDLDLCFRLREHSGKIYYLPNLVVTHVGATSEVSSDLIEKYKAQSFSRYFHENFAGSHPYIVLWLLDIAIWVRYALKVHVLGLLRRIK